MELIYLGEEFYLQSKTVMSSIYDIFGNKQDWGSVQIALMQGQSVHIRPATETEKEPYAKRLEALKKDK